MKFYLQICLFGTLLIIWAKYQNPKLLDKNVPTRPVPEFLKNYKSQMKSDFKKPENAAILFSFFTGNKEGISNYTKKAFRKIYLSYLFTPSGTHLQGMLYLLFFFLKKRSRVFYFGVSLGLLIFPNSFSFHRLGMSRLFNQIKILSKLKYSREFAFYLLFFTLFLWGNFTQSTLSFIYSFFFMGTFVAFSLRSKRELVVALYSTHLVLGILLGNEVSFLGIIIGLLGGFIFSLLFPLLVLFFSTYWLIHFNWGEIIIRSFVLSAHFLSKCLLGTFSSASLPLLLACWVLLINRPFKMKFYLFALFLLIHSGVSSTPTILYT